MVVLWVVAAALVGNGVLLGLSAAGYGYGGRAAVAQDQPAIAGGAGVFVMPAQLTGNSYGAFLLDVDAQTLTAYQYDDRSRQLKLIAARSYRYDRRLTEFNTAAPTPAEVREMVEQQLRPAAGANPSTP